MIINVPGVNTTPSAAEIAVSDEVKKLTGADNVDKSLLNMVNEIYERKKYVIGSYTGNGKCGADNPNILTFDFIPRCIKLLGYLDSSGIFYPSPIRTGNYESKEVIITDTLNTEYIAYRGFCANSGYYNRSYAKKSNDSKTISWYNIGDDKNAWYQLNSADYIFYYIAFE